ncbi:FadR/GntR family transcriptional regulator [Priestia megaterium]|uniref:FadR/GntR family transcriptional regulator n=1 Tax=Priestia megaterium TaxID=1404 RepID=UPI0005AA99C4|nr:GntR family transcriptional regulator [Priestia megaterium]MED4219014.1 GntR family transcriptional regulator [Priestia megaterium]WEZ40633.1 GntR family transcriptional regulator [Priestia megaterium DSM 319]
MKNERSKVYVEILKQIRQLMEDDRLTTGDKIPSERELSERLGAGRSSVREALRALELIGLIETRRGEGTFIKEVGDHQFIDLLATFLVQDGKTKSDLIQTRYILEKSCLYFVLAEQEEINVSKAIQRQNDDCLKNLFDYLFSLQPNRLLHRIWLIICRFSQTFQQNSAPSDILISELVEALAKKDEAAVLNLHHQCYKQV